MTPFISLRHLRVAALMGAIALPVSAQATVIVRQIDEVREGGSGSLSAAFEESAATTQKQSYDVSFSAVFKDRDQEWRSFGSVAYGEVNDVEDEDEQMLHLRHVQHQAFGDWRWETFAQVESDDFADLGQRDLLGGGVSRLLTRDKRWRVLTFLGAMREREEHLTDSAQNRSETRASLSLQGKYTSAHGWTLDGVSYWQPNANGEAADRRVTGELALSFPLSQRLSFTSGYLYRYNGRPFEGVGRENRKLTSGLNFKF